MGWIARRRCARKGHDWFPGHGASEFIVVTQICLRCTDWRALLPWGECLLKHPLAEHYDDDGKQIPHPTCVGPR